ncbi:MAG: hypothetical protein PHX78_11415 [bacterium]|nr:hypothetical protein [bacterium]
MSQVTKSPAKNKKVTLVRRGGSCKVTKTPVTSKERSMAHRAWSWKIVRKVKSRLNRSSSFSSLNSLNNSEGRRKTCPYKTNKSKNKGDRPVAPTNILSNSITNSITILLKTGH